MVGQDSAAAEVPKVAGNLSPKLPWELANPKWAATINPVLSNPLLNGSLLQNISVDSGTNTINHGLGRKLQGYFVSMNDSAVTFYDEQQLNSRPQLTLLLVASGAATISLYVF